MEEALEGVEEGGEGAEEGEEGRRYFCGDGLLGGHGGWGGKSAETETTRNVHGRDRGDAGIGARNRHARGLSAKLRNWIYCVYTWATSSLVSGMHFFPNTSKYHKYQKRMF